MEPSKCCLFSIVSFIMIFSVKSSDLPTDKMMLDYNYSTLPNHGLCHSMDLRNRPQSLARLRNCSVIVGFLQIVLIEQNFSNTEYVFPELREITQYLMLYRVKHLKSIGDIFPNLTLIRGSSLMLNYALVVFEMPNLQEIGLKSLKTIQRGAVRVDSNPQLCFTDTIDWKQITGSTKGNHFSENGNHHLCPSFDACRGCDKYCWSSKFCQKFPSDKCHPECLGGCNQKGQCFRCKNYSDNGFCVKQCPPDKFIFPEANECVTKKDCKKLYRGSGWIFENKCIRDCPIGYYISMGNGTNCKTCILCDGTCNKTCESALITGLQEAEYFKGCHYINGSLNIKIFDEISNAIDITEELEKSLGNITEIKGYLRVYRSTAITSLNFLKNLKVIHGEELYNEKYSFVVFEMSNLQVIFDWDTKKNFTIEKGTLFFNENVKLCLKEIRKLANITGVTVGEHDVCSTSNGFKQFCSRTKMTVENVTVGRNFAVISWKRVNRLMTDIDKSGETLGYLIHYMQHSGNNITTHHGIDSCSRVGWKVKFIPEPQDSKLNSIVYNLTDLTPITKYAFYIQTYNEVKDQQTSVSSEEGESDVHYFKTKISRPPSLEHLAAFSHTENSLTLFWIMSGEYSEIVVQYLVEIYIILDEPEIFDKTNYCKQRFKRNRVSAFPTNFQVNKNYLDENVNCKCRDEKWQKKLDEINERYSKKSRDDCDETEEDETVKTYKDLQKDIDCGYLDKFFGSDHDRFPRNTEQFDIHEILNLESNPDKQIMENVTFGNKYHSYSTYFSAEHTNYTIDNLKHFGKYVIHLAACVEEEGIHCGMAAITSQRTLKHPSADNIGKISTKIYNSSAVAIEWEEPKDPNGIVLSYILQYKRVDTDVKVLLDICITRLEHEENHGKYFLWNLSPGIYSVRVKTRSLGNEGEFSKWTDFVISENVSTIVVLCLLSICLIVAYAVIYLIRLRNSINNDDIDALVTSETYLPASVRYETQMTNEGVEFCNSY